MQLEEIRGKRLKKANCSFQIENVCLGFENCA